VEKYGGCPYIPAMQETGDFIFTGRHVCRKSSPVLLSPHPSGFAEENESAEADSTFVGGTITIKAFTFSRRPY